MVVATERTADHHALAKEFVWWRTTIWPSVRLLSRSPKANSGPSLPYSWSRTMLKTDLITSMRPPTPCTLALESPGISNRSNTYPHKRIWRPLIPHWLGGRRIRAVGFCNGGCSGRSVAWGHCLAKRTMGKFTNAPTGSCRVCFYQ